MRSILLRVVVALICMLEVLTRGPEGCWAELQNDMLQPQTWLSELQFQVQDVPFAFNITVPLPSSMNASLVAAAIVGESQIPDNLVVEEDIYRNRAKEIELAVSGELIDLLCHEFTSEEVDEQHYYNQTSASFDTCSESVHVGNLTTKCKLQVKVKLHGMSEGWLWLFANEELNSSATISSSAFLVSEVCCIT